MGEDFSGEVVFFSLIESGLAEAEDLDAGGDLGVVFKEGADGGGAGEEDGVDVIEIDIEGGFYGDVFVNDCL